jgi:hypothetical protein
VGSRAACVAVDDGSLPRQPSFTSSPPSSVTPMPTRARRANRATCTSIRGATPPPRPRPPRAVTSKCCRA